MELITTGKYPRCSVCHREVQERVEISTGYDEIGDPTYIQICLRCVIEALNTFTPCL